MDCLTASDPDQQVHASAADVSDYEPCGDCGFDHNYEQEGAMRWHREDDTLRAYMPWLYNGRPSSSGRVSHE